MTQKAAVRKTVRLDAPRTLGQEPLYNMETTVRNQFSSVFLTKEDGTKVATIIHKDKKKQTKIGEANHAYLCALILGALCGRGDAPGGACIWTANNAQKMKNLAPYILVAVPDKRGGTQEAPVSLYMDVVRAKAKLLETSMAKHPIPKRVRETKTGGEEEEIDVFL